MKKFFIFAAAAVAAMTINAQVYDLNGMTFAQSDLTVVNGTITDNASKSYFEVKNNEGETVELSIAQLPGIKFTYKNSAVKTAFKVYYVTEGVNAKGKIQMDGNQRDVVFSNVPVGATIVLYVNSKGSTGAQFIDSDKGTAFTGAIAVNPAAPGIGTALPGKDNETDMYPIELTAIANEVVVRETAGGYILHKIQIGQGQGIENADAAVKTEKFYRDGQLIIRKNGVEYNALGAKL